MADLECRCGKEVEFKTLAEGVYCKNNPQAEYVIKTAGDYVTFKSKTEIDAPSSSEIDFSEEMVIALFQGMKNTGGYDIKVTSIKETKDSLDVYVKETCPSADSFVTQVFTSPYHLVKTKYSSKKVNFKKE